jgi:hypothetical protein
MSAPETTALILNFVGKTRAPTRFRSTCFNLVSVIEIENNSCFLVATLSQNPMIRRQKMLRGAPMRLHGKTAPGLDLCIMTVANDRCGRSSHQPFGQSYRVNPDGM